VIETPEKLHGSDDLDTSLSQPLGQLLALEVIPIAGHDHRRVPARAAGSPAHPPDHVAYVVSDSISSFMRRMLCWIGPGSIDSVMDGTCYR
jgi:hypothetical protein